VSRLFVALRPPAAALAELRERLGWMAVDPPGGLRQTPAGQWHVTLRFIGDADAVEVRRRLSGASLPGCTAVVRAQPTLMGRVVVLEVSGLDALAEAVSAATRGLGEQHPRRFRGHLTLARLRRDARGAEVRRWLARHRPEGDGGPDPAWRPRQVELVSSQTRPEGAVHDVLATFCVAGAPGNA
jgi:2'-5' RNA ligase